MSGKYIKFSPLFENFRDIEVRIVHCFQEISEWMVHNKLKLNPDKTEALVIKSRNNFDLEESCIAPQFNWMFQKKYRLLWNCEKSWSIIENYLTFYYHITNIIQSCNIALRNLWMIASRLDFKLKNSAHSLLSSFKTRLL